MSQAPVTPTLIPTLLAAGYVQTAPACGDCRWASEEPQGLFCERVLCLVGEHARCQHWEPATHWIKANPQVAAIYATQPATDTHSALSPAELAYAHKDHALTKPSKQPKWPFPTSQ
jgi:hypothetical protein